MRFGNLNLGVDEFLVKEGGVRGSSYKNGMGTYA